MTPLDVLVAKAQVWLSALFLAGYFIVLILFMLGFARIPPDFKEAFAALLSLMTAGGLTILYFWFQRQRVNGVPDPNTLTTTRTETVVTPPNGDGEGSMRTETVTAPAVPAATTTTTTTPTTTMTEETK